MNKVKQLWKTIVAVVGGIIGLLVYLFLRRGEEIKALKAKINLAQTQKQADAIESEIKQAQLRKDNLNKQNKELEKTAQELETKRKDIKNKTSEMNDPQAIADFWNNQ